MSNTGVGESIRLIPTRQEVYMMNHPQHPGDGSAAKYEHLPHDSIAYKQHYSLEQTLEDPWSTASARELPHE